MGKCMKKALALLIILVMVLGMLSGCSDSIRVSDFDLEEVDVWWMRDNTQDDKSKFYVFDPGSLSLTVNANEKCSVRPMIKVEI